NIVGSAASAHHAPRGGFWPTFRGGKADSPCNPNWAHTRAALDEQADPGGHGNLRRRARQPWRDRLVSPLQEVRHRPMFRFILVPLDGSAHCAAAVPVACTIAHATGSAIQLLRIVPTDSETGRIRRRATSRRAARNLLPAKCLPA